MVSYLTASTNFAIVYRRMHCHGYLEPIFAFLKDVTYDTSTVQGCTDREALLPSPLTGKQFILAGAGGAGRALAFGAKIRGARVVVFDIDFGRILTLKKLFIFLL